MKTFRFDELWLLSESEGRARRLLFTKDRNALVGGNQTGKSTALRLLYGAFGCGYLSLGTEWKPDVTIAADFTVTGTRYTILRQGRMYALFDSARTLMWATLDAGVLRDKFSELLGFVLALTPSRQPETGQVVATKLARPAFYFLPFFIDQDGSWDKRWSTFNGLGEFNGWDRPSIDLALGIRSSDYWSTLGELTSKKAEVAVAEHEQEVLEAARKKLAERFPRTPYFRDAMQFRAELKRLESEAGELAAAQDAVRFRLSEAVSDRDALDAQLKLVDGALREHVADMAFLDTKEPGRDIPCPTCGTVHEHSFHERLNLEAEADELRQLRTTMAARAKRAHAQYHKIVDELEGLDAQAKKVEELLNVQRGELKLREVVDRAGIGRAHEAFDAQRKELDLDLAKLRREAKELSIRLAELDNPTRAQLIRNHFNDTYRSFAIELDVPPGLRTRKGEVKTKPQQGGSGGPRAILAYYFALSHTAARFSSAVIPPMVIDSPHQKAQDDINRPIVTQFIFKNRVPGQQLIVGLEEDLPGSVQLGDTDQKTVLDRKYGLLRASDYPLIKAQMEPLLAAARTYLSELEANSDQQRLFP